jgi:phospholipid/cholesterol/gamma-HCH transport system permease protein
MATPSPSATLSQTGDAQTGVVLALSGRLDASGAAPVWRAALAAARAARGHPLVLNLSGLTHMDMAGAALIAAMEAQHGGGPAVLEGAEPRIAGLIERARASAPKPASARRVPRGFSWRDLLLGWRSATNGIVFLGEVLIAVVALPKRRRLLRRGEFFRHAEQAGVTAIPLVLGVGFLMGLILAFQSAVPMRKFGAVLYVANLVSVSLFRELGPLLTAVILSGRTASAFAAEIGTMKVNQEIDALTSMGLHPVTLLVLPRMAAAFMVMPFLTVALEIAGLLGMAVVMRGFGFTLGVVEYQVQYWTTLGDLLGGLVKAAVFGLVIAAIGCRSGLGTGVGPRAVGRSATAAVVGGIVATILLDGVFAVFYNRLGL